MIKKISFRKHVEATYVALSILFLINVGRLQVTTRKGHLLVSPQPKRTPLAAAAGDVVPELPAINGGSQVKSAGKKTDCYPQLFKKNRCYPSESTKSCSKKRRNMC